MSIPPIPVGSRIRVTYDDGMHHGYRGTVIERNYLTETQQAQWFGVQLDDGCTPDYMIGQVEVISFGDES